MDEETKLLLIELLGDQFIVIFPTKSEVGTTIVTNKTNPNTLLAASKILEQMAKEKAQ